MKKIFRRRTVLSAFLLALAVAITAITVFLCSKSLSAGDESASFRCAEEPLEVTLTESTLHNSPGDAAPLSDAPGIGDISKINSLGDAPNQSGISLLNSGNDDPTDGNLPENSDTPTDIVPNRPETPDTQTNSGGSNIQKNIFEEIYDWVIFYLGDIFSVLAFAIGLITALLYKRGLIPGLNKFGSAIKGSVDSAIEGNERLGAEISKADERLSLLDLKLERACGELEKMKNQIDLEGSLEERAKVIDILKLESDLLYSVFIASSLPQYMKEELNAKYDLIRKEFSKNEQITKP